MGGVNVSRQCTHRHVSFQGESDIATPAHPSKSSAGLRGIKRVAANVSPGVLGLQAGEDVDIYAK